MNIYKEFLAALKETGLSDSYCAEIGEMMSRSLYNKDESKINNPSYYDEIMTARLMKLKKAIQTALINAKVSTTR